MKTFKIHQEVTFYKINEIQAETEKEALAIGQLCVNEDLFQGELINHDYFDETVVTNMGEK